MVTSVVLSCVVTSFIVLDSTVVKLVDNDTVEGSTDAIVFVVSAPSVTDKVVTDDIDSSVGPIDIVVGETEVVTSVVLLCVVASSVLESTVVKLVDNDSVNGSTDVIFSVASAPSVTDIVVTDAVVSNLSVEAIGTVVVETVLCKSVELSCGVTSSRVVGFTVVKLVVNSSVN